MYKNEDKNALKDTCQMVASKKLDDAGQNEWQVSQHRIPSALNQKQMPSVGFHLKVSPANIEGRYVDAQKAPFPGRVGFRNHKYDISIPYWIVRVLHFDPFAFDVTENLTEMLLCIEGLIVETVKKLID